MTAAEVRFVFGLRRTVLCLVLTWSERNLAFHDKSFGSVFSPDAAGRVDMHSFIGVVAGWSESFRFGYDLISFAVGQASILIGYGGDDLFVEAFTHFLHLLNCLFIFA